MGFFKNLIEMVHILIPQNLNLAFFLKAFFYNRYISDFHKKIDVASESDGVQKGTKISQK